jgi:Mycolic acid cyclopropane synthetase
MSVFLAGDTHAHTRTLTLLSALSPMLSALFPLVVGGVAGFVVAATLEQSLPVLYVLLCAVSRLWLLPCAWLLRRISPCTRAGGALAADSLYTTDQLLLNLTWDHCALWQNFGFWLPESGVVGTKGEFVSACERLACLLADEVSLQAGDRLLDVGGGCGDAAHYWGVKYDLQSVVSVNLSAEQCAVGQNRFGRLENTLLRFVVGDASALSSVDELHGVWLCWSVVWCCVLALPCLVCFRAWIVFLRAQCSRSLVCSLDSTPLTR